MTGPATEAWIHVLGLTLLHGVWQGAVVAAVVAALRRATDPRAADARHAIACAGLAVLVAIAVVTAIAVTPAPPEKAAAVAASADGATGLATLEPAGGPAGALRESARRFYGLAWGALPWLVGGWLLGAVVSGLRLVMGLGWAVRARRAARPLEPALEARARSIARRVGTHRSFGVAASSHVEVPTVVGWSHPVVLVPESLVERVAGPEIDALLAHELAHVKRGDERLALVQAVLEVVWFHHPAAWWLARVARAEREHRCDDAALAVCGDLLTYVRALTTLESLRPDLVPVGVAASTGSLLRRVRRLLEPDHGHRGRFARLAPATAGFVLALVFVWVEASVVPRIEAHPGGRMTIAAHDPAGRFGVVIIRSRVLAVGLEGASVARSRWSQRGDSLWVRDPDGDERFAVRVLADGGLEWEPRSESWGRR